MTLVHYFALPPLCVRVVALVFSVFFNDTATTEIYTLSLHDALPISAAASSLPSAATRALRAGTLSSDCPDRKSTRLNSSHTVISYAVFCLKTKKNHQNLPTCKKQKINNIINTIT